MARNVDLWKHLPPFLQDFREMCELVKTENSEFTLAAQEADSMVNELFIQTATDMGLKRFEKILGISPTKGDSLESRRSAIMTRWNDITPYTMTALKNKIIAIQGNEEVEIILSTNRPYEIEIITNLEFPGQVNNLVYLIQTMIPCNLVIHSVNIIKGQSETRLGYGVSASITGNLLLTNDLNENQSVPVPVGVAVGQSMTNTLFLTGDLLEEQRIPVDFGTAAGHSVTNTLFLTDSINENIDVAGVAAIGMGGSFTNIIEIT